MVPSATTGRPPKLIYVEMLKKNEIFLCAFLYEANRLNLEVKK